MSQLLGYAYLVEDLSLQVFPIARPAIIRPVTRVEAMGDCLAVPQKLAPRLGDHLAHVLFALKHEGVNLAVLSQALPKLDATNLLSALATAPSGAYIRKACWLWETFTGQQLPVHGGPKGNAVPLFDPDRYITGPSVRNARWRVDFNGLGSLAYCATVERTPALLTLLDFDVLGRSRAFIKSLPAEMMDRALQWAYLHETRDSFAIEKEAPSQDKAERFVQLLRQAHERQPLTEDYLVSLQSSTISNPILTAAAFRHQQNHLSNGLRGAAGVSYVPPPPSLCRELMHELMDFANSAPQLIDPLVAAGVISFGFVFLHPFMDGNGRLSRFLIHQTLCRSGALEDGLLLPISVAMKREEQAYLQALQTYSRPARMFWDVTWLDAEDVDLQFTGHPSVYRYWDATACVEFTLEMARRALEVELREETAFLQAYDHVVAAVNARFDLIGSDLSKLVMMCLDQGGVVSQNRRKQFQYTVPAAAFDYIEEQARLALSGRTAEVDGD